MSKFTKQLSKLYGSHSLEVIIASNLEEPKKEGQPEKPTEKPTENTGDKLSLSLA